MDTQMEKRTFPTISPQSIMLAKQARLEQQKNGYVTVICPKCQEHPEITMTSRGERTTIVERCTIFGGSFNRKEVSSQYEA